MVSDTCSLDALGIWKGPDLDHNWAGRLLLRVNDDTNTHPLSLSPVSKSLHTNLYAVAMPTQLLHTQTLSESERVQEPDLEVIHSLSYTQRERETYSPTTPGPPPHPPQSPPPQRRSARLGCLPDSYRWPLLAWASASEKHRFNMKRQTGIEISLLERTFPFKSTFCDRWDGGHIEWNHDVKLLWSEGLFPF